MIHSMPFEVSAEGQQAWSEERTTLYHYRTSRGTEVDILLETPDGRVVGVEVKAATTVRSRDTAGLASLRDHLGDRFIGGYVLHTGTATQQVGERISALPISALWAPRAGSTCSLR